MHNSQAMPTLWRIAPHVRACAIDDQVILLDLQRNKYLGIKQARGLAESIVNWPPIGMQSPAVVDTREIHPVLRSLCASGILGTGAPASRREVSLQQATASLDALGADKPHAGLRRLVRFLFSTAAAAAALRFRTLDDIVRAAAERRSGAAADGEVDIERLRELVCVYETLRPLLFGARDNCLFDSLALLGFLAAEGLFPRWVIGVKTRPFAAHSWLQAGSVVVNDQRDHILAFRAILVV